MARFQIYISDEVASDLAPEAAFEKVGLTGGKGLDQATCSEGPDGKQGRVFTWIDPTKVRIGYVPDDQTWIPAAQNGELETGRYWVGFWNDDPPTEKDLRRPDHRRGNFIELGNGESWLITTPDTLDRYAKLESDGSLAWCVDERWNWLVTDLQKRRAESVIQQGEDKDTVTVLFDIQEDIPFLVRLLQVNYRITPEVCSHLKLFVEQPVRKIIAALMGLTLKES